MRRRLTMVIREIDVGVCPIWLTYAYFSQIIKLEADLFQVLVLSLLQQHASAPGGPVFE
jgi:hypothetical protein